MSRCRRGSPTRRSTSPRHATSPMRCSVRSVPAGHGIVHRDVKPANLIRRPDGSVALVDSGAARTIRTSRTVRLSSGPTATCRRSSSGDRRRERRPVFTRRHAGHLLGQVSPAESTRPRPRAPAGSPACLAAVPPVPRPAHRSAPEAHRLGAGSSPGAPGLRPARPSPESRCPGAGCLRPRDDLPRELLRRLPGGRPDQPGAHRTGSARSGALGLPGG